MKGICAILLALLSVVRWDMTDDKRYSLNEATKQMVSSLDAPLEVTVYLDGDLNAGFTRLKRATEQLVTDLDSYGDVTLKPRGEEDLTRIGLSPTIVHERTKDGKTAQTAVWPFAAVSYKGRTAYVTLLHNTRGQSGEENLNQSIENLEYAFAEATHYNSIRRDFFINTGIC